MYTDPYGNPYGNPYGYSNENTNSCVASITTVHALVPKRSDSQSADMFVRASVSSC